MLTCKSPRKVMRVAYELARRCLPDHRCKFSRKDFTLPQLFACLVVREHQNKSYRGVEALLRDSEHWCKQIGMRRIPDHNTLCRAARILRCQSYLDRLLDRMARWAALSKILGFTGAIDSTLYDTHHHSRHYEQRCRHYASRCKKTANSRRSRSARRSPKLSLSVDTATHLILAARARTGMGSDAPDFLPLLRAAKRRWPGLKMVLADAGFDSHENHRVARRQLAVRTLIKAGIGRPSAKPPASRYRRSMQKKLKGSQKGKPFSQRAQAETVNSMMKRNLGDHLRARTPEGRRAEQMLRAITHNISLLIGDEKED
jgi:Transposase DDE domain